LFVEFVLFCILTAANRGIQGGKFMDRRKLKNPKTGTFFDPLEFYVGAIVEINAHKFRLLEGDAFACQYFQDHEDGTLLSSFSIPFNIFFSPSLPTQKTKKEKGRDRTCKCSDWLVRMHVLPRPKAVLLLAFSILLESPPHPPAILLSLSILLSNSFTKNTKKLLWHA
jgi:hypothetical protein